MKSSKQRAWFTAEQDLPQFNKTIFDEGRTEMVDGGHFRTLRISEHGVRRHLCASLIGCYFGLLNAYSLDRSLTSSQGRVFYGPTGTFEYLRNPHYDVLSLYKRIHWGGLFKADKFCLLVNQHDTHWALVTVIFAERQIVYYDSFGYVNEYI